MHFIVHFSYKKTWAIKLYCRLFAVLWFCITFVVANMAFMHKISKTTVCWYFKYRYFICRGYPLVTSVSLFSLILCMLSFIFLLIFRCTKQSSSLLWYGIYTIFNVIRSSDDSSAETILNVTKVFDAYVRPGHDMYYAHTYTYSQHKSHVSRN